MGELAKIKNLVREIIEYNQQVDYYKDLSPLNRDISIDKALNKKFDFILAKLQTASFVEKINETTYKINNPAYDLDLVLYNLNNKEIKIIRGNEK